MKPLPQVVARLNELEKTPNDIMGFNKWATSVLSVLSHIFGEDSVHFKQFAYASRTPGGGIPEIKKCFGIFLAAKEDYAGGYLFKLDSLIAADVFEDQLEQAEELLRCKFKDPACVIAGIVLETSVKRLCDRQSPVGSVLTACCQQLWPVPELCATKLSACLN
jgi:hypothetical protein